jgi:hypothetical protein
VRDGINAREQLGRFLSRLARLRSVTASSPNQLKGVSVSPAQTPAACQSRTRRQHVVPLLQLRTLGDSRGGHPVRKTKLMPASAAGSGTRGPPPLGLTASMGSSGSMASRTSSGTRHAVFMAAHHATPLKSCNTLYGRDDVAGDCV